LTLIGCVVSLVSVSITALLSSAIGSLVSEVFCAIDSTAALSSSCVVGAVVVDVELLP
jgi:hypothetical protein